MFYAIIIILVLLFSSWFGNKLVVTATVTGQGDGFEMFNL